MLGTKVNSLVRLHHQCFLCKRSPVECLRFLGAQVSVTRGSSPIRSRARLPFRIEQWDDGDAHVEELIALVANHAVAKAAFAEAVRRLPGGS